MINKNYRYFLAQDFMSALAGSLSATILIWHLLQRENGIFLVALLNIALNLPGIFSFLFGSLLDQSSAKKYIQLTRLTGLAYILFVITFLTFEWHVSLLLPVVFTRAMIGQNYYVAKKAYIQRLIDKEVLEKANRLESILDSLSGYAFGIAIGLLMIHFNNIHLVIAGIFVQAIAIYLTSKLEKDTPSASVDEKVSKLEGFRYIGKSYAMKMVTLTDILINWLFEGFTIYILIIASQFYQGPMIAGIMDSSLYFGEFLGGIVAALWIFKKMKVGVKGIVSISLYGLLLLVLSFFTNSLFMIPILALSGIFLGIFSICYTTILQGVIPKSEFSKVLSAKYSISVGLKPLGTLFFGTIAYVLSPQAFFIVFGIACILVAALYASSTEIRKLSL